MSNTKEKSGDVLFLRDWCQNSEILTLISEFWEKSTNPEIKTEINSDFKKSLNSEIKVRIPITKNSEKKNLNSDLISEFQEKNWESRD